MINFENKKVEDFEKATKISLPYLKFKDLSNKEIDRRINSINSRLEDEKRILKEKKLKEKINEEIKQNDFNLLNGKYYWEKDSDIINNKKVENINQQKHLSLFDESCYQFPSNNKHLIDLELRFNSKLTVTEVEKDFHKTKDSNIYRKRLDEQINEKIKLKNNFKTEQKHLDEMMIEKYPFGVKTSENKNDFHRKRVKNEIIIKDEEFFPWCSTFGKQNSKVEHAMKQNTQFKAN